MPAASWRELFPNSAVHWQLVVAALEPQSPATPIGFQEAGPVVLGAQERARHGCKARQQHRRRLGREQLRFGDMVHPPVDSGTGPAAQQGRVPSTFDAEKTPLEVLQASVQVPRRCPQGCCAACTQQAQ